MVSNEAHMFRAVMRRDISVVRHMLRSGASVDALDVDMRTHLHYATMNRDIYTAKVLLDACALPHAQDADANTPMHVALLLDDSRMVALLLQYANIPLMHIVRNDKGLTCGHISKMLMNSASTVFLFGMKTSV